MDLLLLRGVQDNIIRGVGRLGPGALALNFRCRRAIQDLDAAGLDGMHLLATRLLAKLRIRLGLRVTAAPPAAS